MGLEIHPETTQKEKVDLTNTQKINLLQNYNFQFNREQLEKLKNNLSQMHEQRMDRYLENGHGQQFLENDPKLDRFLEMKKKFRTIKQEALICSYQTTD